MRLKKAGRNADTAIPDIIESVYAGMDDGGRNLLRAYTYTTDGKVSEIRDFGSVLLSKSDYTYDKVGNRLTETKDGSRKSFHLYGLEGNVIASGRCGGSCAGQYLIYNKDLRGSGGAWDVEPVCVLCR